MTTSRPKVRVASIINGKYLAFRKLGEGGCGVIYEVALVKCPQKRFAFKAETTVPDEDPTLPMEHTVISLLNERNSLHAVKLVEKGKGENYSYIVMSLLGPSLDAIRSAIPTHKFTTFSSLVMVIQALDSLKEIHEIGFVHRDVKPANFAIGALGTPKQRLVHILDFGIARQYQKKDENGDWKLRMPRRIVPFRGTLRYCSIATQDRKEQGRHDDLWSLFYMIVEFIKGNLPWTGISDEEAVKAKKSDTKELYDGLNEKFVLFAKHLQVLHYKNKPDYELLRELLVGVFLAHKFTTDMKVDWEKGGAYDAYFYKKTELLPCVTEKDTTEISLAELLAIPEKVRRITLADATKQEKNYDDDNALNTAQDDTIIESEESVRIRNQRKKREEESRKQQATMSRKYKYKKKPDNRTVTTQQAKEAELIWRRKQAAEYAARLAKRAEAQQRGNRDVVVPDEGSMRYRAKTPTVKRAATPSKSSKK
ncbi:unnamed protein product [Caenorhabditis bovis]|uniref:Protein kinase domain-containing protein n=1 Tax=Caenorhabditis bovis TaxID=2654633 RepID=A0A8S1F6C7_9PELO|nr:unnamed protein product [Caenorhabditis bovis]